VNSAFRKHLTAAETELIEATKPQNLSGLDEDELGDLHDRVRRASRKYRKLHRRQASGQVRSDRSRGAAAAKNTRSAVKAEAFEDALARVSRALAKAAKTSADELKAERLAAASKSKSGPAATRPAAAGSTGSAGKGRKPRARKTPASVKRTASTRASGARRQAKRDSR
jgi:hypothetical protein